MSFSLTIKSALVIFVAAMSCLICAACQDAVSLKDYEPRDPAHPVIKGPAGIVVMAIKDVKAGTAVQASDLKLMLCAEQQIPRNTCRRLEDIVGKCAKYGLVAGQIVNNQELLPLANSSLPAK